MKSLRNQIRALVKRMNTRRALGILAIVFMASAVVLPGGARRQPPFDFSDAFYLANGINPANILDRIDGTCPANDMPACSVVDNSNTHPNPRNIPVLST